MLGAGRLPSAVCLGGQGCWKRKGGAGGNAGPRELPPHTCLDGALGVVVAAGRLGGPGGEQRGAAARGASGLPQNHVQPARARARGNSVHTMRQAHAWLISCRQAGKGGSVDGRRGAATGVAGGEERDGGGRPLNTDRTAKELRGHCRPSRVVLAVHDAQLKLGAAAAVDPALRKGVDALDARLLLHHLIRGRSGGTAQRAGRQH